MPLSEDEQRILSEIEDRLYESDPSLANEVSTTTVYTDPARSLRWAVLGCVTGLVLMVGALSFSYLVAFVGFLVMLVSAIYVERSLRDLGKVSIDQLAQTIKARPGFGLRPGRGIRFRPEDPEDPKEK